MLLIILFIILFLIGIYYGTLDSCSISVIIELNSFSSPHYALGISFRSPTKGIEELYIGMIIVNFRIQFFKEINT